jgi:hypothetical protein
MTFEDLAELVRANSANTNGRIDVMRNETNAALMRTFEGEGHVE